MTFKPSVEELERFDRIADERGTRVKLVHGSFLFGDLCRPGEFYAICEDGSYIIPLRDSRIQARTLRGWKALQGKLRRRLTDRNFTYSCRGMVWLSWNNF